jgi:hypothetical protein
VCDAYITDKSKHRDSDEKHSLARTRITPLFEDPVLVEEITIDDCGDKRKTFKYRVPLSLITHPKYPDKYVEHYKVDECVEYSDCGKFDKFEHT